MAHLEFSEIEHFDSRFEFNSSENNCKNLYFRLSCSFFPIVFSNLEKNIYTPKRVKWRIKDNYIHISNFIWTSRSRRRNSSSPQYTYTQWDNLHFHKSESCSSKFPNCHQATRRGNNSIPSYVEKYNIFTMLSMIQFLGATNQDQLSLHSVNK